MSPISIPGKVTLKQSLDANPYYGAVSLLLHGDGADGSTQIIDSSVNPKTLTAYGDAAVSTAQSKFNGASLAFDGTEDFISTNTSADLRMGTNEFTIEFWFYPTSTANDQYILTSATGAQAWSTMGFTFFTTNTGKIECRSSGGGSAKGVTGASTNTFTVNAWNHVAAVKDVAAGRYYLYLNGVRNNGLTIAFSGNQLEPFTIDPYVTAGGFGTGWNFGSRFNGYIDDIRITKGVCRYTTATFTPPTQPFQSFVARDPQFNAVSLLLKGDGTDGSTTIVDSSPRPKTVTAVGDAQISTAQSKFGGSSLKFDGTGDYLDIPTSTDFGYGTGDFTIEFWCYLTSIPASVPNLIDQRDGTNPRPVPTIYLNSGVLSYYVNGGNRIIGSSLSINTWTHISLCRSGGITKLFANGVQVGSNYSDTTNYIASPVRVFADNDGVGAIYAQPGYLQDLRITKGIARYTSNFTPPGPLPTF